jgi:hypothetical protein
MFFFSSRNEDGGDFKWYTDGIITNIYVSERRVVDNSGNEYIKYIPNIKYEYVVGGVKYIGMDNDQLKV